MRIVDLTTHVLHDGYRNLIFVTLTTDDGLTGVGEATLTNRTEAVVAYLQGHVRPAILGRDPAMAGAIWQEIYLGGFIRGGMIACAGLSGVAQALLDLRGKALGSRLATARRRDPRTRAGLRERLVHRGTRAIGHRGTGAQSCSRRVTAS